jgi:simple sugar transport system permease protein
MAGRMETQVADSPPVSDFRSRLLALSGWARTTVALVATLAAVSIFVALLGANPVDVFDAIIRGSLGTSFNISQTVTVMSILILTGLAAAIPFSARLWNIGGEGQMTAGAVAAATLGIVLPEDLPRLLFPLIVLGGAAIAGALWGFIPGYLKARFDASEVVTSLMLNFVAAFIAVWVISALAGAVASWIFLAHTRLGFSIRAIGANARASRLAGILTNRVTILTFLSAGALAGLAGALIVLGRDHSLQQNFSANFGFIGIGVALTARLRPLAVIPAAFLFAILRVGSSSLQASAGLASSVGEVIVALLVMMLIVTGVIKFLYPESPDAH